MSGMANFSSINDRGNDSDDVQEYEIDTDTDVEDFDGRRVLQPGTNQSSLCNTLVYSGDPKTKNIQLK